MVFVRIVPIWLVAMSVKHVLQVHVAVLHMGVGVVVQPPPRVRGRPRVGP